MVEISEYPCWWEGRILFLCDVLFEAGEFLDEFDKRLEAAKTQKIANVKSKIIKRTADSTTGIGEGPQKRRKVFIINNNQLLNSQFWVCCSHHPF